MIGIKKYAIYVTNRLEEIRSIKIKKLLDEEYKPLISNSSYFLGGCNNHNKKMPKFLNWYNNIDYISSWSSKQEAENYLNEVINTSIKFYNTKKDLFNHLKKTKGDWKKYMFIVIEL